MPGLKSKKIGYIQAEVFWMSNANSHIIAEFEVGSLGFAFALVDRNVKKVEGSNASERFVTSIFLH